MKDKVNEIKISYRDKVGTLKSSPIKSSEDAARLLFKNWDRDTIGLHETFKILLMNNSNKVKGTYPLSTGGITGTLVDMRILFAIILKTLSVAVILVHNHPSGKLPYTKMGGVLYYDREEIMSVLEKNRIHNRF